MEESRVSGAKPILFLLLETWTDHSEIVRQSLETPDNHLAHFPDPESLLSYLKGPPPEGPYCILMEVSDNKSHAALELLKQIKSDSDLKLIPVIMLLQKADPVLVSTYLQNGCNHVLAPGTESQAVATQLGVLAEFLRLTELPLVFRKNRQKSTTSDYLSWNESPAAG